MPTITKILPQKKRPNRRNIYLDGVFAFGLNDNVVARFRLREGLKITDEQVTQIAQGEVRQECFDDAMKYLQSRMHSRAELRRKLLRREFAEPIIEGILDDLTRLGYLDDAKFATAKAQSAADRKHHSRRRAYMELMKSGVKKEVANQVLEDVYSQTDSTATARALIEKKMPAMKRLDPTVARRRLAGMLMRRGFDYETISPVIDAALKSRDDE
jgi:regulatory protein